MLATQNVIAAQTSGGGEQVEAEAVNSKWETILNNVIKKIVLFFLRERWGAAVGKKGRPCGPVPWVFYKKFPQTPCL